MDDITGYVLPGLAILAGLGFLVLVVQHIRQSIVNVPLGQFAIVTRKYSSFRFAGSLAEAVNRQSRLLIGGRVYFRLHRLYEVRIQDMISIPVGSIGIVHAKMGGSLEHGQPIARHVPCDHFQDFETFLDQGGQQGPQIEILDSGGQYAIHPTVFEVRIAKRTYVPLRTIGVVVAKVGEIMPYGHTLARHVECDYFQNGVKFLEDGGQQGPQQALLPGGSYYSINTDMFNVLTQNQIDLETVPLSHHYLEPEDLRLVSVESEETGVVIVTEGLHPVDAAEPAPRIEGHESFQFPWIFLANGGQFGPQSEVLPGGSTYAINPFFARVVRIPSRELILSWGRKEVSADRYDSELDLIEVTLDGFHVSVELTQTFVIPPETAPHLVKRFGEDDEEHGTAGVRKSAAVQRLVTRLLGVVVKGYFNEVSNSHLIEEFISDQNQVRAELKTLVEQALREQNVSPRLTTIGAIKFQSDEMNEEFRHIAKLRQQSRQLGQQLTNAAVETDLKRESIKQEKLERSAELEEDVRILGRDQVAAERMARIDASRQVPQVFVASSDSGVLDLPRRVRGVAHRGGQVPGWVLDTADVQPQPAQLTEAYDRKEQEHGDER
ncbi:SPFH domain-containing protein [Actinosynnema sp. CS-041913]|uniref:SPFH domain-containing protein n=1 Tax=Actinosynnema sp. CS-041913 TaxID=3239917 RepID=UPI003D8C14AA